MESAIFCLTVLALPARRLVLAREYLICSRSLGRDLVLDWQDIQRVVVVKRAGRPRTVRLTVPRTALLRGSMLRLVPHLSGATTVGIELGGWALRYPMAPASVPPLADALPYYIQTPSARRTEH